MAYPAKAIREVIANVLEGTVGTTRTVEEGKFLRGVFDGQNVRAQKALASQKQDADHRFDVSVSPLRSHSASAVSAISSRRIDTLAVVVTVTTSTKTRVEAEARDDVLANIASDCDDAIQALSYPGNLASTLGGVATNVVSGLMLGENGTGHPSWQLVNVDWTRNQARSQIVGSVVVRIDQ